MVGALSTTFLGGEIAEFIGKRTVFGLAALFPMSVLILAINFPEKKHYSLNKAEKKMELENKTEKENRS
jgi:hypothetical protein